MGFLNRLFGTKPPSTAMPPEGGSASSEESARLIKETEHFILLEANVPQRVLLMLLPEATVKQVAQMSHQEFEEAAKMMAGQLYTVSSGPATKEEAVSRGAEISKKAFCAGRYPTASAAIQTKGLASKWDVPVISIGWLP